MENGTEDVSKLEGHGDGTCESRAVNVMNKSVSLSGGRSHACSDRSALYLAPVEDVERTLGSGLCFDIMSDIAW